MCALSASPIAQCVNVVTEQDLVTLQIRQGHHLFRFSYLFGKPGGTLRFHVVAM